MHLLSKPIPTVERITPPNPHARHVRGSSLRPLLLLLSGLVGCAHAPETPPSPSKPAATASAPEDSKLFAFHVSSWVNLYQQLAFEGHPPPGFPVKLPDEEHWTPAERQAWASAVATFHDHTGDGFLAMLYDPTLVGLRQAVEGVPEEGSVASQPGIDPLLTAALNQAVGLYRAHYFPDVSREAQAWVAALEPSLRQYGPTIARELSEVYGAPWPAQPFSVQVSRRASRFGAYTLVNPTLITVSCHAMPNRKEVPLDTVFHEASHALGEPLIEAFHAEFRRQGKPQPRMLWHALLFFTTGEVVRHHLGPDYVPYAYANNLYANDPEWAAFEPVMKREWTPYLEHKVDLQTALRQLVAGYVPPSSQPGAPAP